MSRPPVAVRRASPRAAAWALRVLWRFGRPHTLIGTSLSIVGLYDRSVAGPRVDAVDLLLTLLAGPCVNVFIVGINQVEDVEIDRLNKPWLPIAAGDLSLEAARRIVAAAAIAPLAHGDHPGRGGDVAVSVALAIGWAYSVPPLRLKRYPAMAAGSITFVRSLVVNLGVWLHIAGTPVSAGVWALTPSPSRSRSRSPCSRTCPTSRATGASASPPSRCGSGRGRCWRSASARSRSAGWAWR